MEGRGAGAVAPSVAEEEVEEEAVDSSAGGAIRVVVSLGSIRK